MCFLLAPVVWLGCSWGGSGAEVRLPDGRAAGQRSVFTSCEYVGVRNERMMEPLIDRYRAILCQAVSLCSYEPMPGPEYFQPSK